MDDAGDGTTQLETFSGFRCGFDGESGLFELNMYRMNFNCINGVINKGKDEREDKWV